MPATLTSEQIDDLLWCARSGVEIEDFEAFLAELVEADQDKQAARRELLNKALDGSGNSMLHYACANGHLATLQHLLPTCTLPILLHQNSSGNTPLHWAGLNGHLALCKALIHRIEELERARPEEAEVIKAEHRRQEEEAKAKKAQRENRGDGSTTTAEAEEEARSNDQAALRSIWDVRNTFGRGPTSESQMNDREDVVQYLLLAMGGGADVKPGKSDEAVPDEDETGKSQEKAAQSAGGQGTGDVGGGAVDDVQKKTAGLSVGEGRGEEQAPSTTSS